MVKEGQAEVLFPSLNDKFYNPAQEFNRDLSIAIIQAQAVSKNYASQNYSSQVTGYGITVLEALAASGLRWIRFSKEYRS